MTDPEISAEDLLALALQQAAVVEGKSRSTSEVWFTEEPSRLHRAFKEICERYRKLFPELAELSFSNEGAFPYSPELRQILGNLQLYGIIGRRNPSFDRFSPKLFDDSERVVKNELKFFFGDSREKLDGFERLVEEVRKQLVEAA